MPKEIKEENMEKAEKKMEEAEKEEMKAEKAEEKAPVAVSTVAPAANVEEKKKSSEKSITGIAYIYSTYNNTIIHITDLANNTIAQVSGGRVTKQSRLKATPTVAMFAAKRAAELAKEAGVNEIYVRICSKSGSATPGPGAHSAVKSLGKEGLRIINILDNIPIPRGGPKAKGGKRGRRV